MKSKTYYSVFLGYRPEIIDGQEVLVECWKTIDPELSLNYDEVVEGISSNCPIKQKKAREHLKQYKTAQKLAKGGPYDGKV